MMPLTVFGRCHIIFAMRKIPVILVLLALISAAAIIFVSSCGGGNGETLHFVEVESGTESETQANQGTTVSPQSSQVELKDTSAERLKLCVLPFKNMSSNEQLDTLPDWLSLSLSEQLENSRLVEYKILSAADYSRLTRAIGRTDRERLDEDIASAVLEQNQSEILLFGEILFEDNEVSLEPYVVDLKSGYSERKLEPFRTSRIPDFLRNLNPYTVKLINDIIDLY